MKLTRSAILNALAHGWVIDLSLWKPQSVEWKGNVSYFKDVTNSNLFPVFSTFSRKNKEPFPVSSDLRLRCEIGDNLAFIFLDDAEHKVDELSTSPDLYRNPPKATIHIYKRAKKQMEKYLTKLKSLIEKES